MDELYQRCLLYTSGTHVVIVSDGGKVNIRVGNGTQYGRVTQLAPGTTLDYVCLLYTSKVRRGAGA